MMIGEINYEESFSNNEVIKGTVSRDFRPLIFSSNNFPKAPADTWVMAKKSQRYWTFKSSILASVVNDTVVAKMILI
jgi:hypothetical protein